MLSRLRRKPPASGGSTLQAAATTARAGARLGLVLEPVGGLAQRGSSPLGQGRGWHSRRGQALHTRGALLVALPYVTWSPVGTQRPSPGPRLLRTRLLLAPGGPEPVCALVLSPQPRQLNPSLRAAIGAGETAGRPALVPRRTSLCPETWPPRQPVAVVTKENRGQIPKCITHP